MFWIFMLIAGGAATFAALGMYAVWFKVLTIALMMAALVIAGMVGFIFWKNLSNK